LSTRQQIIANALRQRYGEVCKTSSQPVPNAFGEMNDFVSRLRKQFVKAPEAQQFRKWTAPETWFESRCDSLAAIRALAADEQLVWKATEPPQESGFFRDLQAATREPQRRFDLLTTRYLHPLNVAAPADHRIREHLLESLMVADRARIERHSLHLLNPEDLLLRLNLIAINASLSDDLRYLDALNYYYELLPTGWYPESPHNWLRVSLLNFYVRALAAHFTYIN
jgi:hypothetical protein